jgi:hypothetical protein
VFAKLAWFGLAKREQEQRWTITDLGISFIEGRARVQVVALTIAREFAGLTGDLVKASDVNESFYFGTV